VAKLQNLNAEDFAPILAELGLAPDVVQVVDPAPPPPSENRPPPPLARGNLLYGQIGGGLDTRIASKLYRERGDGALPPDGWALFFLKDRRTDDELARWRNSFWPWLHMVAVYRIDAGRIERQTLQGVALLAGKCEKNGVLLVARRREHVLSPATTVEKFDANAGGWNIEPGKPGHAHFRWMRRYVARFARARAGAAILDFGCGSGWVGIEAALAAGRAPLRAFDPAPEMVKNAAENARSAGLTDFEARAGFGEQPPFDPARDGRFEVVLSSGVVSFAPHILKWIDGLCSTVAPGGTLVVGDINRDARGMLRRRATRVLLPAREMNALITSEMRGALEKRGFVHEATAGYQLTRPVPELMHWSDTRCGGALTPPLLLLNKLAAGRMALGAFDSWVLRMRAPR
jgi:2-polyprenyl-3-methyl-5-hydroxy-6-metoxy-1,4-benzoquinol methylase